MSYIYSRTLLSTLEQGKTVKSSLIKLQFSFILIIKEHISKYGAYK